MRLYAGTDIAKPKPLYELDAAAEFGNARMAAFASEWPQVVGMRNGRPTVVRVSRATVAREAADIVTSHVPPWQRVEPLSLDGSALAFVKLALERGHEVAAKAAAGAVCVAVRSPRVRLYWVDGKTTGGVLDGHKVTVTAARGAL